MPNAKLDRLKAEKATLEARIRQEMGRERSRQYKLDTRRKILAGAAVLDEAEQRPEYKAALLKLLGRFLDKPQDRELFGLPPLSAAPSNVHELVQPEAGADDAEEFAPRPGNEGAATARV